MAAPRQLWRPFQGPCRAVGVHRASYSAGTSAGLRDPVPEKNLLGFVAYCNPWCTLTFEQCAFAGRAWIDDKHVGNDASCFDSAIQSGGMSFSPKTLCVAGILIHAAGPHPPSADTLRNIMGNYVVPPQSKVKQLHLKSIDKEADGKEWGQKTRHIVEAA